MLIHIGYELVFDLPAPVAMQFMLYLRPELAHVLQKPERIVLDPDVPIITSIDGFGNRIGRILAPAGTLRIYYDNIAWDTGLHEPGITDTSVLPVQSLPDECIPFLLASRYCEVDRLSDIAWDLFGNTPPTWQRVQAIMDWVHGHVAFGYEFARSTKSAFDVYIEKQGVCRDFMHLAITLLRAMNIPARYATGYLGDIGVPISPLPMDFSAWLEVYLSGRWFALDARHNEPRIARIQQAHGRDAVDVAISTTFGQSKLRTFGVWTEEVNAGDNMRNG